MPAKQLDTAALWQALVVRKNSVGPTALATELPTPGFGLLASNFDNAVVLFQQHRTSLGRMQLSGKISSSLPTYNHI